jgi:signal transduction histidine kinase
MHIPDPEATALDQDRWLGERIRAEVKALLNQHEDLAHLQKAAAVKEKVMRMSHDIRNPLATIQAVCGSLILETEDAEQLQRLQTISNQVEQLSLLLAGAVNDQIDHEDVSTWVDLVYLSQSLVNLLQYQAQDGLEIHLHLSSALYCHLPQRALARSLYQLLYNAMEALDGYAQGEIHLELRKKDDQLQIDVMDNGPGLPEELLVNGLRTYAAVRQGCALGLSSVERFARSLEGRLELSNRDTGGACVSLLLPVDCRDKETTPTWME